MHIENGDLILGLHDLDHILSGAAITDRDGFLEAFEKSGELWMAGLMESEVDGPILDKLAAIGARRNVIRLDHVMTGGPGLDLNCFPM